MDPMTAFLLSMQGAGLVTSLFGAQSQDSFIKLGRKLEQEQFTTNLQAIRVQSAQASLDEMKQLRSNIGSQIVAQAAKGNRGASSYKGIEKASQEFDKDERIRGLNLMAAESKLRAGHLDSVFKSLNAQSQLGQNLTKQVINSLQTSSLFGPQGGQKSGAWVDPDKTSSFSWGF